MKEEKPIKKEGKAADKKTEDEKMAMYTELAEILAQGAPTIMEAIISRIDNIEVEIKHKRIRINFK